MNVLLTGMQRSGTTLLRRIFGIHPQVKKMFHETFFFARFKSKLLLTRHIKATSVNPKKDFWGEKCPYYPNLKRINPKVYCKTFHNWYPKKFRVVHIIRHPIDIANSNVAKFKHIKNIKTSLNMYKAIIPRIVQEFDEMPYILQIKYEHLLQEPDIVIPKMYSFCGLKPNIDFRARLMKLKNKKYQQLDSSRLFAFRNLEQNVKMDFTDVFNLLNKIDGPKY